MVPRPLSIIKLLELLGSVVGDDGAPVLPPDVSDPPPHPTRRLSKKANIVADNNFFILTSSHLFLTINIFISKLKLMLNNIT